MTLDFRSPFVTFRPERASGHRMFCYPQLAWTPADKPRGDCEPHRSRRKAAWPSSPSWTKTVTGQPVTDRQMASLSLKRDNFHGDTESRQNKQFILARFLGAGRLPVRTQTEMRRHLPAASRARPAVRRWRPPFRPGRRLARRGLTGRAAEGRAGTSARRRRLSAGALALCRCPADGFEGLSLGRFARHRSTMPGNGPKRQIQENSVG